MKRVHAYILAGGQSSRFGSDKARATLNGEVLIQHVAGLLSPVASSITVVAARTDQYADLGFRTIADLRPGLGPMAGLQTALIDLSAQANELLLCSCDVAVLRGEWLEQLLQAWDTEYDAIAFQSRRWQPMPGLYARSAMPLVSRCMNDGNRSMQGLLEQLRSLGLPQPPDWPEHWQINSPQDLQRHQRGRQG